jgi:transcriptional regulator with GAF, ATPase, and Fis domain
MNKLEKRAITAAKIPSKLALGYLCAPDSPMEKILDMAIAVAKRDSPVLLQGESGTGKEVLANILHAHSSRSGGPFMAVNCAAISHGLIESELFGHKRGAFTHAVSDRPGNIRMADGGTLFLDEIGDMPLELQARFLRVLQEKKVRPVGGDEEKSVDFRLVCATHRDLEDEVRLGRFREDLYYRLRVLEVRLPPLRERVVYIPFLLRTFLAEMDSPESVDAAMAELPDSIMTHPFPGNVRELRNLAERYIALRSMGFGWEHTLNTRPRRAPSSASPVATAERPGIRNSRLQDEEVIEALEACGFHRGLAAARLGVTRRTLQYHLERMRVKG